MRKIRFLTEFVAILSDFSATLNLPMPLWMIDSIERWLWTNPGRVYYFLSRVDSKFLEQISERKLIKSLPYFVKSTPAMKDFYKKNKVNLRKVKSLKSFKENVPIINKHNYISVYQTEELCVKGRFPPRGMLYKSSGSSGKPTLWVQSEDETRFYDSFIPFGMEYAFDTLDKDYIILNCWAFGTWPTAIEFSLGALKEDLVLNVGTDLEEALRNIELFGDRYEMVISGYPPFLKHMIEEGEMRGMNWKKYKLHLLSGGESFVEEWRDFMKEHLWPHAKVYSSYGSTDKGIGEGIETMLTIAIRNLARVALYYLISEKKGRELAKNYFGSSKHVVPKDKVSARNFLYDLFGMDFDKERILPMLFQYDPTVYFNENYKRKMPDGREVNEVVTTVLRDNITMPRVRYNIEDEGGVLAFKDVMRLLEKYGYDIQPVLKKLNISQKSIIPLPFLYIKNRSDGTISVDGANIFPEEVGEMIDNVKSISNIVNSFKMTVSDKGMFGLNFELKHGKKMPNKREIKKDIKENLPLYSSGYDAISKERLKSADMDVEFYRFGEGPFTDNPLLNKGFVKFHYISKTIAKK